MNLANLISPVLLRLGAAVASGCLLASAFPPGSRVESAWLAFVPLLMMAKRSSPSVAFKWGWLSGLVFWLASMSWLLALARTGTTWPIAILGWASLSAYAALYTGAFCMMASIYWQTMGPGEDADAGEECDTGAVSGSAVNNKLGANVGAMALLPLCWVGFEYIRSTLFTGCPWNALGVSQYRNLAVIQVAEFGGVYAVSALVMLVNIGIAATMDRFAVLYGHRQRRWRPSFELMIGLGTLALCWSHGIRVVKEGRPSEDAVEMRMVAVQPGIAQVKKWDENSEAEVYEALLSETEFACGLGTDLIIWPETALPRMMRYDEDAMEFVANLSRRGTPMLVGSVDGESVGGKERIYNSSFLVNTNGKIVAEYRKCHLVPFGEYLPFDKSVDFIAKLAPLGFSCTPGTESTVFHMGRMAFSVLICIEDAFAYLARRSVRNGARLLINQTNDAWFDGSPGAMQHMSHCVFRCIENRVPAVRVANTGITCFIDSVGHVDMLKDENDRASTTAGWKRINALLDGGSHRATFYTKYGDLPFALPCGIISAALFLLAILRMKRGKSVSTDIS